MLIDTYALLLNKSHVFRVALLINIDYDIITEFLQAFIYRVSMEIICLFANFMVMFETSLRSFQLREVLTRYFFRKFHSKIFIDSIAYFIPEREKIVFALKIYHPISIVENSHTYTIS